MISKLLLGVVLGPATIFQQFIEGSEKKIGSHNENTAFPRISRKSEKQLKVKKNYLKKFFDYQWVPQRKYSNTKKKFFQPKITEKCKSHCSFASRYRERQFEIFECKNCKLHSFLPEFSPSNRLIRPSVWVSGCLGVCTFQSFSAVSSVRRVVLPLKTTKNDQN